MRKKDIENTCKTFSFLLDLGFALNIKEEGIVYEKEELRLELWFDYYGFQIECILIHNEERINLIELVDYFDLDKKGYYYMFHSYDQIEKVLNQYAKYLKMLVEKNVFDPVTFGNIAAWSQIRSMCSKRR